MAFKPYVQPYSLKPVICARFVCACVKENQVPMLNWIAQRVWTKRNAHDLYGSIVALSRSRVLYADMGVPDTVESRFELLVLHLFACLDRLSQTGGKNASLAQEMVDIFIADMETVSRELGVGDMAVPKRMRELAAVFEERMKTYKEATGKNNKQALAAALAENIFGRSCELAMKQALTSYVLELQKSLSETPIAELEAGRIHASGVAMFANGSA